MNSETEVDNFLAAYSLPSKIDGELALEVIKNLHDVLPIDLGLMSTFGRINARIDIDKWNGHLDSVLKNLKNAKMDNQIYLFINCNPSKRLFLLDCKLGLKIITNDQFYWPFALFTKSFKDCIMEDLSGYIVGYGGFEFVVNGLKG